MSVNKVILIGNVGKDPEVRYFDNNVAVANFTLATTERGYTGRDGQPVPDRTEWHNLVVWRGLAQVVEKYVRKGSSIYVEGKIRTRSYDDKEHIKRYVTEIYVDELRLLGRKSDQPASESNLSAADAVASSGSVSADPFMPNFTPSPSADDVFGSGHENDLPF